MVLRKRDARQIEPSHSAARKCFRWAPENAEWLLASFVVIAVLGVGNLDLITGRSAPQWDGADYFGPEFSLIADHIKSGRLLLWDPWVAAGSPASAEPEFGTTSPIVLAVGMLSPNPQAGFVLYWMLIWALGPLGVLVLCRHLGCPVWGGLIAAIGFAACGFYTGHAQHTAHLYSVSFLPWLLWRFDLALSRRSYWNAIQAGAIYGLSALGGYPVYTIVTPGFLVLWSVGRVFDTGEGRPTSRQEKLLYSATAILLMTVVGAAIISPAYVGFFKDTRGYSDRNGPRSREAALKENILPAGDLTSFASPYISLLEVKPSRFWPFADISMRSIYAGSVLTVLAMAGLLRHSKFRWWLFLVALLFLGCAAGYQLPLRGWLYDFVFPTRYFRNAASLRTYAILIAIVLCAFGARDLRYLVPENDDRVRLRLLISSVCLAIASTTTFAIVTHFATSPLSTFGFGLLHALIAWWSIVLAAWLYWKRKLLPTAFYTLLVAISLYDGIATLRISRISIHSPWTLLFWHTMNARHDPDLNLSSHGAFRQLDPPEPLNNHPPSRYPSNRNIPLRIATLDNDITMRNRFYSQIEHDPLVRQMALGKDRFWFVSEANWIAPTDGSFSVYLDAVRQLGRPLVVLHSREQMDTISDNNIEDGGQMLTNLSISRVAAVSLAHVSRLSYWPNALSFHYFADKGGWLLVTDRWAPGWTARVNGQAQEVLGADFVYRAVRVESGDNLVQLRYRPWGWPYLLFLSWGTLLVIGGCQVVINIRSACAMQNVTPMT